MHQPLVFVWGDTQMPSLEILAKKHTPKIKDVVYQVVNSSQLLYL